jgi:hypothetical protein
LLQYKAFRKQFIKKHYASNGHLRHAGELIGDVTVPEDGDQHVVKKMKMSEWVFYLLILK